MKPAELPRSPDPPSAGDMLVRALADAIAIHLEERQQTSAPKKRLLTMDQAVEYLGMSEDTIMRLVNEKRLRAVRVDRYNRFDLRDLDALIDEGKTRRS